MGKGQRARNERAGKREEMKIRAAKIKRRKKINKIIGICAGVVAVLAIAFGIAYNAVAATGYFLRNTVAMSSDNYTVDNAMMTYYLKNEYYTFTNQYSNYLSMYGLDTSKSLKRQSYGDSTWFDYFMGQAKTRVNDILLCAEKARAEGYELGEDDKKEIDDSIASMKSYAEENKISFENYLGTVFDKGIKEDDVRRALELSALASKYYNDYSDSLEYSDEDLQKYFDENKSDYVKADYMKYTFTADVASDADDAAKQQAKDDAKAKAVSLSESASVEAFTETITGYLTEQEEKSRAESESSDNSEEEGSDGEDSTPTVEEAVADAVESAKSTMSYPAEDSEDKVAKWLFEDGRKIGDTYITEPDADATTFNYVVYIVTKTAYSDDYNTVNARHILFTTETYETVEKATEKAKEVLAEYNNGEKTEEAFAELAKKYSEDSTAKDNGGLYENITNDTQAYPESFVNWCYDDARKSGDVDIVSTDTSVHLIYYCGQGETAWKSVARVNKNVEDCEAHVDSLAESYTVVAKDGVIKKIKA